METKLKFLAWRRFAAANRAAAAIEFAFSALALLTFLLAVLNLGDLGLVLQTLQRGVQGAARQAAVAAASDIANHTACPAGPVVQRYFNGIVLLPQVASDTVLSTPNGSMASSPWSSTDAVLPGSFIVLTAAYRWTPFGLAGLGPGVNLNLSAAAFVLGSTAVQSC